MRGQFVFAAVAIATFASSSAWAQTICDELKAKADKTLREINSLTETNGSDRSKWPPQIKTRLADLNRDGQALGLAARQFDCPSLSWPEDYEEERNKRSAEERRRYDPDIDSLDISDELKDELRHARDKDPDGFRNQLKGIQDVLDRQKKDAQRKKEEAGLDPGIDRRPGGGLMGQIGGGIGNLVGKPKDSTPAQQDSQDQKTKQPATRKCETTHVLATDGAAIGVSMNVAIDGMCRSRWSPRDNLNLAVAIIGTPSHGSASLAGTTVVYRPSKGYAGQDSFMASVSWVDGKNGKHKRSTIMYSVTVE